MSVSQVAERSAAYALQSAMEPALGASFDLMATAPQGVAKLRELILSLAVRGRLVPQDPSDEPAGVLIRRARAEKHRQAADGKITREKPDKKSLFKVPKGWEWVILGAIAEVERGGSPRPIQSFLTNDPDGLNWIKIGDTDQGGKYITSTKEKIRREGLSKTRMVLPGDFLLTNSMSFGRPYITQIEGCIHDGWLRISPPSSLNKDYLFALLSSQFIRMRFVSAAAGGVVQNLNADKVRGVPIPVPPIAEQARIVARVEELMELCDALEAHGRLQDEQHARLVATLFDALAASASADELAVNWQRIAAHFDLLLDRPEAVDALEQTLLQLAVRGLLVPQDPNDEPARELIDRVHAENERLIADGNIKRRKPCLPISEEDKIFELPESWEWVRFGFLINSSEAGWSPKCENGARQGSSWGVLKVSAVSWGEFRSWENKQLPSNLEPRPEYEVHAGDFLISRANTAELVARSVVVSKPEPKLMLSDKIIRCHISNLVSQNFLNIVNNVQSSRDYYAVNASGTSSSMKNVGRQVILNLPIALPPLAEQHRIVARVEQLRRICTDLRERLQQSRTAQSRLADALVAQAGP